MTEAFVIPEWAGFIAQFLWIPWLYWVLEKQKTTKQAETEEKKLTAEEIQNLKIQLAVLEKTSITDTYLRNYMEDRLGKMEEKFEGKIDKVSVTLAEILRSLPKRKAEQE